MSNVPSLDVTEFLTGPDLLQRNAFRLAQMPVDATDRKLNKRQQMIEMARKMGMPSPEGISPIFPIEGTSGEDGLKEALHRMRDPMNRLFDELFWFWPHTFGDSENDEGLKLLSENKVEEALKFWKQGEQETENFVSTHNLAVLHQFLALQVDERMIFDKSAFTPDGVGGFFGFGGNKEEKASRKHWKEAFTRWLLLTKQESFWNFLKARIHSINHPGLPVESADWLRENMSSILFSINVGLIVSAAEEDLEGHVKRQWDFLADSGFNSEDVDTVFEIFTHKYRQRIQHLCTTAKNDTKRDSIQGHTRARHLAKQATSVLRLLSNMYPNGDKAVNTLHDEVAETILHCQVVYGNKTENWIVSEDLLNLAEPIARSETAKSRITDNIKNVQELREAGNDWCEEGYFDLPEPCIEVLEKARTCEDAKQYTDALDLLRKALFGIIDLPAHPNFRKHLHHCIAYTFKSKSIVAFNQGIKEHDQKVRKILIDSIQCDGGIGDGYGFCASCMGRFYGSYVNRTIDDHTFPFCTKCSSQVDRKFKDLDADLNKVKRECLDLMVLASAFDSGSKVVSRNLKSIRDDARESQIKERAPRVLKIEWDLVDPEETIVLLTFGGTSYKDIPTLFKNLSRAISAQSDTAKQRTLVKLFDESTKNGARFLQLLPQIRTDAYIFAEFIKQVLIGYIKEYAGRETAIQTILSIEEPSLRFEIINQIEKFYEGPNDLSEWFVASLSYLIAPLVVSEGSGISFTSGKCGDLLLLASQYSRDLEEKLIKELISAGALKLSNTNIPEFLKKVHAHERARHIFYSGIFFSPGAFESQVQKTIIDTINASEDLALQFAILENLKELGDQTSPSVETMKSAIHSRFLAVAEKQIELDIYEWTTNGSLPQALNYAMSYSKDFEESLFFGLLSICGKNINYATNFIKGLTIVKADRERLLTFLNATSNPLDKIAHASIIKVMAEHWDADIRLVALRDSHASLTREEKVRFLIRFLGDDNQSVRSLAHTQLLSFPNELFRNCIEPLRSAAERQQQEMRALLRELFSQINFQMWKPSLSDIFGILAGTKDPEMIKIFAHVLKQCYPSWVTDESTKSCVSYLKYAAKNGFNEQAKVAKELLELLNGQSFGTKVSLWFTWATPPESPVVSQDAWWKLRLLDKLSVDHGFFNRKPTDARETIGGASGSIAPSIGLRDSKDERQQILQMVKGLDGETFFFCPICETHLKAKNLIRHYDSQHLKISESMVQASNVLLGREGILQIAKNTDGNVKVYCPNCGIYVEAKYLVEHYDDQHGNDNLDQDRVETSKAQGSYKGEPTVLKREYAAASQNRKLEILKTFRDKGWKW